MENTFYLISGGKVYVGEISLMPFFGGPENGDHIYRFFFQGYTMPLRASYMLYDKLLEENPDASSKADLIEAYKKAYKERKIQVFSDTYDKDIDKTEYADRWIIQSFQEDTPPAYRRPVVSYEKDVYFDLLKFLNRAPEDLTREEIVQEIGIPGDVNLFRNEFQFLIYEYILSQFNVQAPPKSHEDLILFQWNDYFSLFAYAADPTRTYELANYCIARDILVDLLLPNAKRKPEFFAEVDKILTDTTTQEELENDPKLKGKYKKFLKAKDALHKMLEETGQEKNEIIYLKF